ARMSTRGEGLLARRAMAIEFTCPACGATLRVTDDAAGRLVRCGGGPGPLPGPGGAAAPPAPRLPPANPHPPPPPPPTPPPPPPGAADRPAPAPAPEPPRPYPEPGLSEPAAPGRRGPLFWVALATGALGAVLCACCGVVALMPGPQWREYNSDQGGFRVELPGEPRPGIPAPGLRA